MKSNNDLFPTYFPESWAESHGQDDYGLWQGVTIAAIEVRFRWLPPGSFIMGSPEYEPERSSSEGPQHRVSFARGFWLAETACSQALWLAVMKENPSRFKKDDKDSPELPVENVSWRMAMDFIERINKQVPRLAFRLPTEAEWEYACRAGTTTPFSFGDKLSMGDANYHSNFPYNKGEKGEYREKTLPVKSFRPNPWGLYQMHGNVWEWCWDRWHENYRDKPQLDGSIVWEEGDSKLRVCRGCSWFNYGGSLRSACRDNGIDASVFSGLRLARGPEQEQQ